MRAHILLTAAVTGCMTSPQTGFEMTLGVESMHPVFSGYTWNPLATVEVQAWDRCQEAWVPILRTLSSADPETWGTTGYRWSDDPWGQPSDYTSWYDVSEYICLLSPDGYYTGITDETIRLRAIEMPGSYGQVLMTFTVESYGCTVEQMLLGVDAASAYLACQEPTGEVTVQVHRPEPAQVCIDGCLAAQEWYATYTAINQTVLDAAGIEFSTDEYGYYRWNFHREQAAPLLTGSYDPAAEAVFALCQPDYWRVRQDLTWDPVYDHAEIMNDALFDLYVATGSATALTAHFDMTAEIMPGLTELLGYAIDCDAQPAPSLP